MFFSSFFMCRTYADLFGGYPSEHGNKAIRARFREKAKRIYGGDNLFVWKPRITVRDVGKGKMIHKSYEMPYYCFIGHTHLGPDDGFTIIMYKNKPIPPSVEFMNKLYKEHLKDRIKIG